MQISCDSLVLPSNIHSLCPLFVDSLIGKAFKHVGATERPAIIFVYNKCYEEDCRTMEETTKSFISNHDPDALLLSHYSTVKAIAIPHKNIFPQLFDRQMNELKVLSVCRVNWKWNKLLIRGAFLKRWKSSSIEWRNRYCPRALGFNCSAKLLQNLMTFTLENLRFLSDYLLCVKRCFEVVGRLTPLQDVLASKAKSFFDYTCDGNAAYYLLCRRAAIKILSAIVAEDWKNRKAIPSDKVWNHVSPT